MLATGDGEPGQGRSAPALVRAAAERYGQQFGAFFVLALGGTVLAWLLELAGARPAPAPPVPGLPAFAMGAFGGRLMPNPIMAVLAAIVDIVLYSTLLSLAGGGVTGATDAPVTRDPALAPGGIADALPRGIRRFWPLLVVLVITGVAGGLGMMLLVVPGVLLLTWWAVAAPVAVLEGRGATAALGRSHRLTRGHFWHVLGTLALTAIVVGLASLVLLFVVGLPLAQLPAPLGPALSGLWTAGVQALLAPYSACLITLLYLDLRARS